MSISGETIRSRDYKRMQAVILIENPIFDSLSDQLVAGRRGSHHLLLVLDAQPAD